MLVSELALLRAYRAGRKARLPWRMRLGWYRNKLRHLVNKQWPGGYVLLEEGDYLYVPEEIELHGATVLLRPFSYSPLIKKFCAPGSTVIDVGANIGEWSLPMAKEVGPTGRPMAFEPIPFLCDALNKSFRVNSLGHAQAHDVALSNKTGVAEFFMYYSSERVLDSGGSGLEKQNQNAQTVQVHTMTLDDFLAVRCVNQVGFIKIDVEGHEYAVLEGAQQTLARHRPVLVVEVGHETMERRQLIQDMLAALNYAPVGVVVDKGILPASWGSYRNLSAPFATDRIG